MSLWGEPVEARSVATGSDLCKTAELAETAKNPPHARLVTLNPELQGSEATELATGNRPKGSFRGFNHACFASAIAPRLMIKSASIEVQLRLDSSAFKSSGIGG